MLASPDAMARAELTSGQIAAIDGKNGIRVFTADGDYHGATDGSSFSQGQTRLFLRPLQGSLFRRYGIHNVIASTDTDQLALRGNDLVLASSTQRVKTKTNFSAWDDPPTVKVFLPRLR